MNFFVTSSLDFCPAIKSNAFCPSPLEGEEAKTWACASKPLVFAGEGLISLCTSPLTPPSGGGGQPALAQPSHLKLVRRLTSFIWLTVLLALTGCALMEKPAEPPQLYILPPPVAQKAQTTPPKPVTVKVALPEVAAGLDTPRIAVREPGYKLSYIARASWPEPLPAMLQARLVDGLEKSGIVKGVSSDAASVQSNYILQMDVQEFNAVKGDDPTAPAHIRVRYRALLLATDSHTLVTSIPAEEEITASANTMEAIIAAFNTAEDNAMHIILPKLAAALGGK